ncbi:MAG: hypothetical protein ABSF96_10435 [Steroidobacteraceae bacterium]|jgi:hypothetical protein
MPYPIGSRIRFGPAAVAGLCAALACASAPVAAQVRELYCGPGVPAGFDQLPPHARTGLYVNATYGYSLTIPAGLTAYTDQSGPERDLFMMLSQSAGSTLTVSAAYDIFYDITAQGVHRRDINAIRMHDALLNDRAEDVALADVAGGRYVLLLQCRGEAQPVVHEELIVLRNREIYRLDLRSSPQQYQSDRRVLDAILRSWRWVRSPAH